MESPLGDLGGVRRLRAQGDPVLARTGQAGFPAFLMLSQVPRNWIGTEVVFHSPVVLRSRGVSCRDCGGVCQLSAQGDPVLVTTGRG